MTAKEAHEKSMWNQVNPQLREWIKESIEDGKVYCILPDNTTLIFRDQYALEKLGYTIDFNDTTNSHEIYWGNF